MNPRPAFAFLLLFLLASLMVVHLKHLMEKQALCEKYAVEVLRGLRNDPPLYREEFSAACKGVTGDFDKSTEKYLAVLVSLLSGAALGRLDK